MVDVIVNKRFGDGIFPDDCDWPDIPAGVSWSLVSDNGDTYTIRVSEVDAVIIGGAE
jgi:hypothetical protein